MSSTGAPRLAFSVLGKEGFEERDVSLAGIDQALRELERQEVWELTVHPVEDFPQFPRLHIDWHHGFGFVVMAFENERSIGFYPIAGATLGMPVAPIELGGQALEKWPRELFVTREIASQVLQTFLQTGRQDAAFNWVANDKFDREIIWEDEQGRIAWEKQQHK